MKKFTFSKGTFTLLFLVFLWNIKSSGQCQFPNPIPVYLQTFGAGTRPAVSPLTIYQVPELIYTGTGNMDPEKIYTITPTSNLHSNPNAWWTVSDHTGNPNGLMMLVNDREPAGVTYRDRLHSSVLGQSNLYNFSAWAMNILKPGVCTASGNNPDIIINLTVDYKAAGVWTNLVTSTTFTYPSPVAAPDWKNINVNFTTPAGPYDSVRFNVNNASVVLCGNDYVLDDIRITGCVNNISLPVHLMSFTANYRNGFTTLNWEVDNEVNFSHYEIERKSTAAASFNSIAMQALSGGTGKSTYQLSDNISNLSDETLLYRLKMVDLDGSFKYSNVLMVRKDQKTISGISVSPNPVTSGDVPVIRFQSSANNAVVTLRIVDWNGRTILKQETKVSEGVNSIPVNNIQKLQPGIYVLQVSNGAEMITSKLSVVR